MADVSPDLFMDAVLAYQQTAAIKAALELDLFTEIAKALPRPEVPPVLFVGPHTFNYLPVRGHLEKQVTSSDSPSTAAF